MLGPNSTFIYKEKLKIYKIRFHKATFIDSYLNFKEPVYYLSSNMDNMVYLIFRKDSWDDPFWMYPIGMQSQLPCLTLDQNMDGRPLG